MIEVRSPIIPSSLIRLLQTFVILKNLLINILKLQIYFKDLNLIKGSKSSSVLYFSQGFIKFLLSNPEVRTFLRFSLILEFNFNAYFVNITRRHYNLYNHQIITWYLHIILIIEFVDPEGANWIIGMNLTSKKIRESDLRFLNFATRRVHEGSRRELWGNYQVGFRIRFGLDLNLEPRSRTSSWKSTTGVQLPGSGTCFC